MSHFEKSSHSGDGKTRVLKEHHFVRLDSIEKQMDLQTRLALLSYKIYHVGVSGSFSSIKPETVDKQIKNSAMKAWVEDYAEAFREWLSGGDKQEVFDLSNEEELWRVLRDISAIAIENKKALLINEQPPTIH